MSTNAISSQGTILKMGLTSNAVSMVIGEVTNFNGPGGSATVIDATDLSSTAKEKVMGNPDEGNFQFDINWLPNDANHYALTQARATRALRHFELSVANPPKVIKWAGYVTEFSVKGGVDELLTASVTSEITGPVIWPSVS